MGARALSPASPPLHDPHGGSPPPVTRISIPVDTGRALDTLRACWGDVYTVIDIDGDGRWRALRGDAGRGVSGTGPDDLLAAIMADLARHPAAS